jgi:hypothetical protein
VCEQVQVCVVVLHSHVLLREKQCHIASRKDALNNGRCNGSDGMYRTSRTMVASSFGCFRFQYSNGIAIAIVLLYSTVRDLIGSLS